MGRKLLGFLGAESGKLSVPADVPAPVCVTGSSAVRVPSLTSSCAHTCLTSTFPGSILGSAERLALCLFAAPVAHVSSTDPEPPAQVKDSIPSPHLSHLTLPSREVLILDCLLTQASDFWVAHCIHTSAISGCHHEAPTSGKALRYAMEELALSRSLISRLCWRWSLMSPSPNLSAE